MKISTFTLIKPTELSGIINETNKIEETLYQTKKFGVQKKFVYKLCDQILKEIRIKLEHLLPTSRRQRKGIINFAGSIIKTITKNLDAEDGERYEKAIEELRNRQGVITHAQNQKFEIMTDALEKVNNTLSHIKVSQEKIADTIKAVETQLQTMSEKKANLTKEFVTEEIYNHMIQALNHINEILESILSGITFAKINVMHPSIITNS